jgi:HAMP domain-containing protein
VSQIKVGHAGRAFVVDGQGALIAHPDISLVLQHTSMENLPQVRAALAGPGAAPGGDVTIARDREGRRVLTAHSTIAPLGWSVFVEQPLGEAFQPLSASITRTMVLIALGVTFAVAASLFLARRMVQPIRALEQGAAKIGAGELGHRIEVKTGDEVEALARALQPDDGAAPGILRDPRAAGGRAHARAVGRPPAADGHGRGPAGDQQLSHGPHPRLPDDPEQRHHAL